MAVLFTDFVLDAYGNLKKADGKILCHVIDEHGERDTVPIAEEDLVNCGIIVPQQQSKPPESETPQSETSRSEAEENPNVNDSVEWTDESTKFLLDKYGEYLAQVGPMKKFKIKRQMWEQIAADILKYLKLKKTWIQCENRYKTILKRKKIAATKNRTSGEERATVAFEQELHKIRSIDDSVEPAVLRDVSQVKEKENEKQGVKRKTPKLADTLYKIHVEKEEGRERRHKERCDLIKSLTETLRSSNSNPSD